MKNLSLIIIFAFLSMTAFAQKPTDGCAENSDDDKNPLLVGVYNFVPDAGAKAADLRKLLEAPTEFVATLEANQTYRVLDGRTPVLLSDPTLELPEITERFDPPPAQSQAKIYFVGKISKTNDGFLLTVDLKDAANDSLISEQKLPFANESNAGATGKAAALAMQPALAARKLAMRTKRDTDANVAIDPHINLVIDKERIKPNETAKIKINLVDCDGKPLANRPVSVTVKTDFTPPVSLSNDLKTDALGAIDDTAGASKPTVLRYTAIYKYKDLNGAEQTIGASQPLIIGSMEGYWLLYVEFYHYFNIYDKLLDIPTPWNRYGRSRDIASGSVNIILKAKTDASGTSTGFGDVVAFDGFIYRSIKGDTTISESGMVQRQSFQELNTTEEGNEMFEAGFSINLEEKTFSGTVASLPLKGMQSKQQITCFGPGECGYGTYTNKEESDIAHEHGGLGCQSEITPAILQGGVFRCSSREAENLARKDKKEWVTGTKSLEIKVALRSLDDTNLKIKKK